MANPTYTKDFLVSLYRTMVRIREFEESLVEPIQQGEIKTPCHLYTGEEAIAAGVCAALTQDDYAFGYHRSHGHYLAKGGDMNALAAEIYGKETGCSKGRGGSMHIVAKEQGFLGSVPIVAGTVSLATGAALASKIARENRIAVSFFGDGAMGEGVVYESLNLAAVQKLPVLFVCENNFYSTHLPLREVRAKDNIVDSAISLGVPGFVVDGNNVLEVFESVRAHREEIRNGGGPVFLECRTYRMRGHVGPDDNIQGTHADIRPQSEIEEWKKKDPLLQFEKVLAEQGIEKSEVEHVTKEAKREVQKAHEFARNSDYPKPEELTQHVFSE